MMQSASQLCAAVHFMSPDFSAFTNGKSVLRRVPSNLDRLLKAMNIQLILRRVYERLKTLAARQPVFKTLPFEGILNALYHKTSFDYLHLCN